MRKCLVLGLWLLLSGGVRGAETLYFAVSTNATVTLDPVYLNSNAVRLVSISPTNCSAVLTNNQIRFTATNTVVTNFLAYVLLDLYTNLSTNSITVYVVGEPKPGPQFTTNVTVRWDYKLNARVFTTNVTATGFDVPVPARTNVSITLSTNYNTVFRSTWNFITFRYELRPNSGYTVTAHTNFTVTGHPVSPNSGPLVVPSFTTNVYLGKVLALDLNPHIVDTNAGYTPRVSSAIAARGYAYVGDDNQLLFYPRLDFFGSDTVAITAVDNTRNFGIGVASILVKVPPPYVIPSTEHYPAVTTIVGVGATNTYGTNSPWHDVYLYRGDTTRFTFTNLYDPSGLPLAITNVSYAETTTVSNDSITVTPTNVGNAVLSFSITNGFSALPISITTHRLNHTLVFTNQTFTLLTGNSVSFSPSNYLYYAGRPSLVWTNGQPATYTPTNAGTNTYTYNISDGYTNVTGHVYVVSTNTPVVPLFPVMTSVNTPSGYLVTGSWPSRSGSSIFAAIEGSGAIYAIDVQAGTTAWVTMQLPAPALPSSYKVNCFAAPGGYTAYWFLKGSTNATDWDTLSTVSIGTSGTVTNSISATNYYSYFRIQFQYPFWGQSGSFYPYPGVADFQVYGHY